MEAIQTNPSFLSVIIVGYFPALSETEMHPFIIIIIITVAGSATFKDSTTFVDSASDFTTSTNSTSSTLTYHPSFLSFSSSIVIFIVAFIELDLFSSSFVFAWLVAVFGVIIAKELIATKVHV